MAGYVVDLRGEVQTNDNFRKVLFTALHSQLVAMALNPKEDIGTEVHEVDQFIYVQEGRGVAVLDNEESPLDAGVAVVVPAGTEHNILNTGDKKMRLFTLYAPGEHDDGTVEATKADAEKVP